MTVTLRPYQATDTARIYEAWQHHQTVLHRADTGYGKTAVLSYILANHVGSSIVIAHRDTIVAQLSLMLARFGIRHNIIASKVSCRQIADLHVKETGRNWYDPNARCAVASVDTLVRRKDLGPWLASITLAIVDEGHHVTVGNKWHTALTLMTHAALKILLPTATPRRPDGKGLGREPIGDGIADVMVEANPMSWLMDQGYLTRYYPPLIADSHMAEAAGAIGSTGDWSTAQLRKAVEAGSTIIGDVVAVYTKVNTGQYRDIPAAPHGAYLDVVFAPDVKTATEMLHAYRAAGYKAELLTGETDAGVRRRVFADFERRVVTVIIAVDIISEGTDMPAVEMVQQARLTASIVIYMQQFGRGLRPLWGDAPPPMDETPEAQAARLAAIAGSCKPALIYVDHVGNFLRHGPPDRLRDWSLARTRGSNGPSGAIPSRVCLNPPCSHPYERVLSECPYCGTPAPPPAERSSPDVVDGDIVQMDPAVLDALLGKVKEAGLSLDDYRAKLAATGLPQAYISANAKKHHARLQHQQVLHDAMALWGGRHHADGRSDSYIRRLFWFTFGIDVGHAQLLGPAEAEELAGRVALDLV